MDKSNFTHIYYFPKLMCVHLKIYLHIRTPSSCVDISEVWSDRDVLDMVYPGLGNLKDVWDQYQLVQHTDICRVNNDGVFVWNKNLGSWRK